MSRSTLVNAGVSATIRRPRHQRHAVALLLALLVAEHCDNDRRGQHTRRDSLAKDHRRQLPGTLGQCRTLLTPPAFERKGAKLRYLNAC